jgi:choline dehydrogenase-like flavoprotein
MTVAPQLRVRGIEGLREIDTSFMPGIGRGRTIARVTNMRDQHLLRRDQISLSNFLE